MQKLSGIRTRAEQTTAVSQKLAYLRFACPDLDACEKFLTDFGLQTVEKSDKLMYMRSVDAEPFCYMAEHAEEAAFLGLGFLVASRNELEKLSALPEASSIATSNYPGGGEYVRLRDPSGFVVDAVYGQSTTASLQHRAALEFNFEKKHTRINDTQRPPVSPPEILRLGHIALEVAKFKETFEWYVEHFGFIASDIQVLPDGSPVVAFMRMNLGDTPADHHTIALAQSFMPTYSHSAFEVVDADAVGMGQRVLHEGGWKHSWGIGRHILGSQIFDYWQDPWGNKFEHYCDGDVFTDDVPTGTYPVSKKAMYQWGPKMPSSFTRPKFSFKLIKEIIYNLRHSPDLSIKKLITLAKIFS